jgi:Putative prokaryotic signal transducing protein
LEKIKNMTTITTFHSLPEAQMVQSVLKGSGVESFIPDEFTAQNDWTLINAIGGIRVQVDIDDVKMAKEILTEYSNKQSTEKENEKA